MVAEVKGKTPKSLNLFQRLLKVMEEVDYVQKENKKVNGQYTFVSHDAVTAKVRPALVKQGIMAIPTVISKNQDGNRTEVEIGVTFVNVDDPQDKFAVQYFGYGIDTQDKGPGKAISYAVKYALLKVLGLETGDDPEKESIDHKGNTPKEPAAPKAPAPKVIAPPATTPKTALDIVFEGFKEKVEKHTLSDVEAAKEHFKGTKYESDVNRLLADY